MESKLKEYFSYCPISGNFTRIKNTQGKSKIGDIVGSTTKTGYREINFKGSKYYEHRLAWYFYYGEWPKGVIDHIDRNKLNNSISNLRDIPKQVNHTNRNKNRNNTSGITGVHKHPDGYTINIGNCYKGFRKTLEEASIFRRDLEKEMKYMCE